MDNQQEIPETDFAWLAGIIDGEGHISIYADPPTKGGAARTFRVRVLVSNTDAGMIQKIVSILDMTGINCHVREAPEKTVQGSYWTVQLLRMDAIAKILPRLVPYLVTKQSRALLAIRFITSRIERGAKRGRQLEYSPNELEAVLECALVNSQGRSSETTREASARLTAVA